VQKGSAMVISVPEKEALFRELFQKVDKILHFFIVSWAIFAK
jgi:hypothetical protein